MKPKEEEAEENNQSKRTGLFSFLSFHGNSPSSTNNENNSSGNSPSSTNNENNSNNFSNGTNNNSHNKSNINTNVLERISLLEDQIKSLQKELKEKEDANNIHNNRRSKIRFSTNNHKQKKFITDQSTAVSSSPSASTTSTDQISTSIDSEDVFIDNTIDYQTTSSPISGFSQSTSTRLMKSLDESHDHFDEDEFVESGEVIMDSSYSEEEASMSFEAKKSRSFRYNSFMTRRINADDDYKALSEDTFTMMIMSKPGDKQWWYAFTIFLIQIALLVMILHDQYSYKYQTTPFDVPYKVHPVVRSGQLLAILLSLATQTDLVIAIVTFIMLWRRRRISWTTVTAVASDSNISIWTLRVALPLSFKFIEGVLVLVTTFVIVIQSDSMIELFKDFAAMQLISELDNMMFWLAVHGYAGVALMEGAKKAQKVRIKDDVVKSFCGVPLRTLVLVVVFCSMLGCWSYIVVGQVSGNFFYLKFPLCGISKDDIATMNDGICDGGAQNTIECNFDDGDCLAFNIAYPGCRVVETQHIGDGICDPMFNLPECGFDGGDCCPVMEDDRLGDEFCDGYVFNTEICNYDDGDCLAFNEKYPECNPLDDYTLTELWNEYNKRSHHLFAIGDGVCDNVPIYNTPECGYDGGDCEECFNHFNKQLQLEEFQVRHFDKFGDGTCDPKSPLNIEICGYEGRDCYECIVNELDDPNTNITKLGDGVCDGGNFNSYYCYYDGGDCLDFVDEYPNCDAEFPSKIGDGVCDIEYDYDDCGNDGGDCDQLKDKYNIYDCLVEDLNLIGNGVCDGGQYLTEECAFEGGDCDNCTISDKTMRIAYIGDGLCDGAKYLNEECGYDGGDCDNCFTKNIFKVGDGNCDEELNTFPCGYDGGDCLPEYNNDDDFYDDNYDYYDYNGTSDQHGKDIFGSFSTSGAKSYLMKKAQIKWGGGGGRR